MQRIPTRTVFDVITDFLASEPSPPEIIDCFMPEDLQTRLDELLDNNRAGEIALSERQSDVFSVENQDEALTETSEIT